MNRRVDHSRPQARRYSPSLPSRVEEDVASWKMESATPRGRSQERMITDAAHSSPDRSLSTSPEQKRIPLHRVVPLPFQGGAVKLLYRDVLLKIDGDLVSRDLKSIKFLYMDHIQPAILESVDRGLTLFKHLTQASLMGEEDIGFLAEGLFRIHRIDALKKLGLTKRFMESSLQNNGSRLSKIRVFLFGLCNEITDKEVAAILFLAEDKFTKSQTNEITDPYKLMTALLQTSEISGRDLSVLSDLFNTIGRGDLYNKVKHFEKQNVHPAGKQTRNRGKPSSPNMAPLATQQPASTSRVTPTGFKDTGSMDPIIGAHGGTCIPTPEPPVHKSESYGTEMAQRVQNNPNATKNRSVSLTPAQLSQQMREGRQNTSADPSEPSRNRPRSPVGPPGLPACVDDFQDERFIFPRDFQAVAQGAAADVTPEKDSTDSDNSASVSDEDMEMPCYPMRSSPRDNLQYIFGKKLKFEIKYFENLTETEMVRTMVDVAYNIDHTPYDCFVCCILTHGSIGNVFGVNGRMIPIKDLTSCFRANMCPSLKGKPKLFFIQACQGKDKQEVELDGPEADDPGNQGEPMETVPNESDFLLGYATLPGFVSYRSKTHGSWYITKLVEMLDKYSDRYDLLSILIKVNEEVGKANAVFKDPRGDNVKHYKQSPAPLFTLRKKVYFNPQMAYRK